MALPKLNTPTYMLTVPSTKAEVTFRPYLVKEEKVLMMASESQDEKQMISAMKTLIGTCTYDVVNPDDLTMFDLEYLFVKIRSKSVGETSTVRLTCQEDNCEHKTDVIFNLDDVSVSNIEDSQGAKIELEPNVGLIMKYPTVNDIMDISNGTDLEKMMGMVRLSIQSIYTAEEVFNTKDQTKQEVEDFIDSLSSMQFTLLREWLEKLPTTEVSVDYKCGDCSKNNSIVLSGAANFFG